MILLRKLILLGIVALMAALTGCATIDSDYRDPGDPFESYNRSMHRFNDGLDRAIFKPVARGYNAIVPDPVNRGVTNFFGNLADVTSAINNVLQLKIGRALNDVGRILVNTTLGVFGFMDVASNMNIPKSGEDFGQTLGVWGMGPGPYIVWPILGPRTGRDTIGMVVDWYTDPVYYVEDDTVRWSLRGLRFVDARADLLGASRIMEEAALDPYAFLRDAYLQKRRDKVYDGNPPPETFE